MLETCWCGGVPHQIKIGPVFYDSWKGYEIQCQVCGFTCQHPDFKEALHLWNEECAARKRGVSPK